ncbi:hypothetical protein PaG_03877 [Moesziomyces aphidis]|uniref:Phosphatidic acid phosphatase type 2/haloperoxidase domain-containing protein n=1 Tax=Moesziomyces aphidis TaxID=84754 RepID=W3VJV5_MOEAP|nr:hypothetical protein PaG_03877 [Moesziomyces aphidis]
MPHSSSTLQQRRTPAVREASTSSIDEDRKISGSWINGSASTPPSRPDLTVNTNTANAAQLAADPDKKGKRGHVQKHEKIERIGLLRGSSYVKSTDKDSVAQHELTTSIGLQDEAVYDAYLPRPIAILRRIIVAVLRKEAPLHERHQRWIRRPWLDRYFVNTSLLGTHSFFLVFLPMIFWLGSPRFGRGLINVLAFGVYLSSAIKDLFCVPRPYSPPVTRLTVGTHHLEYGFPSTHSTNSVSIALYIYLWVRRMREHAIGNVDASGIFDSWLWEAGLLFYGTSVVYGRIYAGMHSVIDCVAGSALGAAITAVQWRFFDPIEDFIRTGNWWVPAVIVPAGLLMVSVHPQPVDDCPCFEDAIAFVSVAMGVALARWSGIRYGITLATDPIIHAFSSAAASFAEAGTEAVQAAAEVVPLIQFPAAGAAEKWIKSALVMVFGLVNVLLLRVIVKTACKVILPPTFRLVDQLVGFSLPRRHYTPASDYNKIPLADLSAVPSVIDLPSQIIVTDESGKQQTIQSPLGSPVPSRRGSADVRGSIGSALTPLAAASPVLARSPVVSPVPSRTPSPNPIEMRRTLQKRKIQFTIGSPSDDPDDRQETTSPSADRLAKSPVAATPAPTAAKDAEVKHYDADVLTKVIVYTNIGLFSAGLIPAFFERLGLNP